MKLGTQPSILRSTAVVGLFTGVSRLLGFGREMLMAYFFGTSLAKSAFDVAFRIPNLFRSIFGEGALSAAFVPVYTDRIARADRETADILAGRIMTLLGAILTILVGLGMLMAWGLGTSGILPSEWDSIIPLLLIMFPYTLFICLVALCMGILNSHARFWVPAASPSLMNIIAIAGIVVFRPWFGNSPEEQIYAVAWAILVAGGVQLLFQVPFLRGISFEPKVSFAWREDGVREFLRLLTPGMVGMGIIQINVFISTCLSMSVGSWAPAALTYAERLIYLPLGLFATALGSVLLPTFSHQAAKDDVCSLLKTFETSFKILTFIMLPVALFLFILAHPFVSWVFEWKGGVFNGESSIRTARAVMAYAPGLVVFSLYKVIAPVFYATKDTKTPVTVAILAVLVNLGLNLASISYLPAGFEHAGMAAANVLASFLNCMVLLLIIRRRLVDFQFASMVLRLLRMTLACLIACMVLYSCFPLVDEWLLEQIAISKIARVVSMTVSTLLALAVYWAGGFLLCREEVGIIMERIRNRRRRREGLA